MTDKRKNRLEPYELRKRLMEEVIQAMDRAKVNGAKTGTNKQTVH